MPRRFDHQVTLSEQIGVGDVAGLPAQGFTMLINNRPDGEDPDQPMAGDIEEAAARAGLSYRHIPIIRGIGPGDVEAMSDALEEAGDGQVFAFCRSGTRSGLVVALARRRLGSPAEEVEQALTSAGIDPGPIAHLL